MSDSEFSDTEGFIKILEENEAAKAASSGNDKREMNEVTEENGTTEKIENLTNLPSSQTANENQTKK